MMHASPLLTAAQHIKEEAKSISPKLAFIGTGLTLTILGYILFKDMKHTAQELMRELDRQKPIKRDEPEAESEHGHRHRRHEGHRR